MPGRSKYLLTLEDSTKERSNLIEISNKPYDLVEILRALAASNSTAPTPPRSLSGAHKVLNSGQRFERSAELGAVAGGAQRHEPGIRQVADHVLAYFSRGTTSSWHSTISVGRCSRGTSARLSEKKSNPCKLLGDSYISFAKILAQLLAQHGRVGAAHQ